MRVRLRDYVGKHGFDSFNAEDFAFVGEQVDKDPERLILVGGQALETWALVLDVPRPTGDVAPLTDDLDWLGGKRDALWLCGLLGRHDTDLQLAGPAEPGLSTGLAYLKRPDGRVLMLDFLRAIVGPTEAEVAALAVPLRVNNFRINVLHPIHCLHSRLANLQHIPAKRTGNGPLQAQWSIAIAEAFIRQRIADNAPVKEITRACHAVAENAEYKSGPYGFDNFGLDPLRAVAPDIVATVGGRFERDDWPRTLERITRKRERRAARRLAAYKGAYTPNEKGV